MSLSQTLTLFTGETANTSILNETIAYHIDEASNISALKQLIDEASVIRTLAQRAAATPTANPEFPKPNHHVLDLWLNFLLCAFIFGFLIGGCLFAFWKRKCLVEKVETQLHDEAVERAVKNIASSVWAEEGRLRGESRRMDGKWEMEVTAEA